MPDIIVSPSVHAMLNSSNVSSIRNVLNVYDRPVVDNLMTSYGSNSGTWINTSNIVNSNIANWNYAYDSVYLNTQTLSAFVESKVSRVSLGSISNSFNFDDQQSGLIMSYSNTQNITAYITPQINTPNYVTTVAQLSSGNIVIKLADDYTNGKLISYGDLYETAGGGATANIIRVSDNTFLITGLLQ